MNGSPTRYINIEEIIKEFETAGLQDVGNPEHLKKIPFPVFTALNNIRVATIMAKTLAELNKEGK